jgi:hypothetical protein
MFRSYFRNAKELAAYLQRAGLPIEGVFESTYLQCAESPNIGYPVILNTDYPMVLIRFKGSLAFCKEQQKKMASGSPDDVIAGFFGIALGSNWVKSVHIVECPTPEEAQAIVNIDMQRRSFKTYVGFAYGRFAILGDEECVEFVRKAL